MSTTSRVRHAWLSLLVPVLLLPIAAAACAQAAKPSTPPGQNDFLRLYRGYQADYEPAATMAQLAEWSEVVAVGRLKEIREGRKVGVAAEDPGRAEHLIYVFEITENVKGAVPGDVAYVQALKPSLEPAERFDAAAPKNDPAVLYLRSASPPPSDKVVVAPPNALPANARLMRFTTPQGFVILLRGGVVSPLEQRGPSQPLFRKGDPDQKNLRSWLPPTPQP
jgi:hypothetical protein